MRLEDAVVTLENSLVKAKGKASSNNTRFYQRLASIEV